MGIKKGVYYSYRSILINDNSSEEYAEVDHFYQIKKVKILNNIDGVWNLASASSSCNRSCDGKMARIPLLSLLNCLYKLNEYFNNSHLALKETIIQQTGYTELIRKVFSQKSYNEAKRNFSFF